MLDNLRRTLSAPAAFLTLLVAWLDLPGASPALWTAFVLADHRRARAPAGRWAVLIPRRRGISKRSYMRARSAATSCWPPRRSALTLTMLAHQAWLMTRRDRADARPRVRDAPPAPGMGDRGAGQGRAPPRSRAASIAGWPAASRSPSPRPSRWRGARPQAWPAALPFLAAVGGVARGRALDQPAPDAPCRTEPLSLADAAALRLIARRTWRFFATFVGPEDHALAARQLPGNAEPGRRPSHLARRTSACICSSTVAARDFGWLGTLDTVERLEATLETMRQPRALSRPLLQLVRHAAVASRSSRSTSRRSTAAISPAICIALAHACREMAADPCSAPCRAGRNRRHGAARARVGPCVDATVARSRAALDGALWTRRSPPSRRRSGRPR